ncbi:hypothetical protein [Prochlorococcus sp. MIT 1201]|uniref:hypothetical protein n=1 Tax=Prochlorococcus sp. MIT 1201 TaxID=3082535 RepID=UPI0039A5E40D
MGTVRLLFLIGKEKMRVVIPVTGIMVVDLLIGILNTLSELRIGLVKGLMMEMKNHLSWLFR